MRGYLRHIQLGVSAQFFYGERQLLAALLIVGLIRGLVYTVIVPPWQHPDEPTHFEYVRLIAETRQVPAMADISLPLRHEIAYSMLAHNFWKGMPQPPLDDVNLSRIDSSPLGFSALSQPRLYYVLGAVWLSPWLNLPVETQLYVVRLFSVILNLLVVISAFYTARQLFPDRDDAMFGVACFLLFQPMYTDIMAAANNDALVNTLAALFFLVVARAYRNRLTWRLAGLAGLLLVGAVLSKATALSLVAVVPLVAMLYPWRLKWNAVGRLGIAALGMAGMVVMGVAVSRVSDPLWQNFGGLMARYLRADIPATLQGLIAPASQHVYYQSTVIVFQSFWAAFGWRHVLLARGWYWGPGLATLAAAVGLAWQSLRWVWRKAWRQADIWQARYLLFSLGAVIVAWIVTITRSQVMQGLAPYLSHGRYAFVAIVPFAILFTVGLLYWLPERWRTGGFMVYLAALMAFDALAFWGYLTPYYYGH